MESQDWLDKVKLLSNEQLIKTHFALQEKIKKAYKLREESSNLKKSINLCEQQIAMAPMVIKAMREDHDEGKRQAKALVASASANEFYPPSHHGYRQLCIILKKSKQFEKVTELQAKRDNEGWAS